MLLTDWARQQGVSARTARRWFHAGTLPVPALQMASGTILVEDKAIFGEPCPTCGRPVRMNESVER